MHLLRKIVIASNKMMTNILSFNISFAFSPHKGPCKCYDELKSYREEFDQRLRQHAKFHDAFLVFDCVLSVLVLF